MHLSWILLDTLKHLSPVASELDSRYVGPEEETAKLNAKKKGPVPGRVGKVITVKDTAYIT